MKALMCCGAAALVLLSLPAQAQDKRTVEPNALTVAAKRPPMQLNERQRGAIQDALAEEDTEQKTPPNFAPEVGDTLPLTVKVDVMPQRLVAREPSLQPFGYAKLARQVLVIDPMKKTIIAILPRRAPTSAKKETPGDWAKTRGRELTGQAPEATADKDAAPEPAGDSGDTKNGDVQSKNEK